MFKKGTIVLVPFPFTDLSGHKVRPAVIVSKNKVGNDVVVLFITSQSKLRGKHLVSIDPDPHNGLKAKSQVICSKLATLETKIILGEVGSISAAIQKQIDGELKQVLGLSVPKGY